MARVVAQTLTDQALGHFIWSDVFLLELSELDFPGFLHRSLSGGFIIFESEQSRSRFLDLLLVFPDGSHFLSESGELVSMFGGQLSENLLPDGDVQQTFAREGYLVDSTLQKPFHLESGLLPKPS